MKHKQKNRIVAWLLSLAALMLLLSQSANAQLIGEGDTLWYKSGFPEIRQVQFTPDGTKLGVLGAVDIGVFTMFDAFNGNELWTFKLATHYFYQFTYSLDGSKVFILPPTYAKINVLDVNTGIILDSLPFVTKITTYGYGQVYQTKNPNILLLANGTECFALYDIAERKIIKEKVGNLINEIFACPYSDYFISAYQYESDNKWKTMIRMYDINTLEFVATLGEEEGLVNAGEAKISYDGKYAATNFGTRALQIWDLENKKLFKEYSPTIKTETTSGGGPQTALAFCHDNLTIVNCGGNYTDWIEIASTLTNFMNDKRAIIYPKGGFNKIEISNLDSKLVGGVGRNLVMLKLKNEAVPVKDESKDAQEIIYPNPTNSTLQLNVNPELFGGIWIIRDINGIILQNGKINPLPQLILNLIEIPIGTYYLQFTNDNISKIYKLIIAR